MSDKENTVTISKDTIYGLVIAVLAILLLLSVFTGGFGVVKANCPPSTAQNCTAPIDNDTGTNPPANQTKVMEIPQTLADAPLMGSATSPVTVLEFSDFQCPFCGLAYGSPWSAGYESSYGPIIGTVKKIEDEYAKTGKAAFRHFPVAFLGQESVDASNAALCAGAQGKYWEMHDAIYTAQTPEENDGKYSKDNLKLLAQNITGLDQTAFGACVDVDHYVSEVQAFTTDWNTVSYANSGRAGTPTFYVLVASSSVTEEELSSAAEAAGFAWGPSSDGKTYLVVASPEYAKLKGFLDAVAG
ncbi:MAG: thioredoxin domain-containing protein [Candidatus ainarchaeum sp.]|nr:thioredoxin domain-containing protein [Candidatus ainarchaeum sp.]